MRHGVVLMGIICGMGIGLTTNYEIPWKCLNPIPTDNGFHGCYAINSNTLILLDMEAPMVHKTTDGGLTWSTKPLFVTDTLYSLAAQVDFPDSVTGYIAGVTFNLATYRHGVILKTTDQGESWNLKYLHPTPGSTTRLIDIDFPQGNNQVGYAVGVGCLILKTTNGGDTWIQQSNPGATNQDLRAVHFPVDANTGYAVGGWFSYDTLYPIILKTTNGGQNWVQQTSPVNGGYWDVHFINNNLGYACGASGVAHGTNPKGVIIKTTNGGNNWQVIYNRPGEYARGIYFLNSNTGFVFIVKAGGGAYPSLIRRTTNGGASWDSIIPPQRCDVYQKFTFSFANQQIGYGSGKDYDGNFGRGRLFKTTDGGITWRSLKQGIDSISWRAVDFPENDQIGYVVGVLGYICKTTDRGATWVRQWTGTSRHLFDVDFLNNQIGFAVGSFGTLLKTTDGGATWLPKNTNTTERLRAVKFVNAQIGYIAGGTGSMPSFGDPPGVRGVILKTTNGGDTWINQTIPNNNQERAIQDLFFFNADTGYAVAGAAENDGGAVGLVYKTTNGGQTWVVNYAPSVGGNFYAIDFPENSRVGYISGMMGRSGDYKIIKTTNGGNTWTGQRLDNHIVPVASVSFANNNIGYAAHNSFQGANMYKTTDGGVTWTKHNSYTHHVLNDILAIRNTDIVYGVGAGGMIIKTTSGGSGWIKEEEGQKFEPKNENGLLQVYPNPFRNNLTIRFAIHNPQSEVSLRIYDVAGRVVKQFNPLSLNLEGGIGQSDCIIWDTKDNAGCKLPDGVYFVQLKCGDYHQVEKVIMLR